MKDVGENVTHPCKHMLFVIYGFVVLVTIPDAYSVPEAPETFLAAPNGLLWGLNNAHWLTILHGQTHNVVAFLRLKFVIGDWAAPLS